MPRTTTARKKRSPQAPADGSAARTDEFLAAFSAALAKGFKTHGAKAIAAAREKDPVTYLKICTSILPKPAGPDADPLGALSDEQLLERARRAASSLGFRLESEPADAPGPADPAADR